MALSYVQYTGDGSTTDRAVPFPFISRSHVEVKVDNVVTAFTWVTDGTIRISPAPAAGTTIDIRRNTPDDSRLVDFQDASSLTEADLDLSANQQFYLQQELIDREADAIRLDTDTQYNALSRIIKNVADGVAGTDAINRRQLTAAQLGTAGPYANLVEVTPAGKLAATQVQAALEELDAEKPSTLNTVADLRASTVFNGAYIVLGYTTAGDGGGGLFRYDSASTAADNGGTVFKPNSIGSESPGRWLRVHTGHFNVKWFGATGNGTTNDSAAVQAAIDYVESLTSDGVALVFPSGDYLVSGLTVDARVHLIGNGATIKAAATTGNILSLSATAQMSIIEGFRFDSGSQRTAGDYIKLTGTYWVTIRDCSFWRYYNAIHGDGAVSTGVDNCQFQEPTPSTTAAGGAAIVLDTNNNVDWRLSNLIADCAVDEPSYGIKAVYTDALTIVNCDIINHGSCLALVPGTGQAVAATFVANSYFDNSVTGLDINPSGTGTVTRVSIEGCWFGSNSFHNVYINQTGSTVIEGVSIGGGQNVLSAGNGIATVGTVNGLVVSGGIYSGNTSSGISLSAGTTKCAITGAVIGVGSGSTGNAYGIFLNTSTGDVMIANNVITGNVTADIGGTAGTARFDNNITGTSSTVASTATLTLPVDKDFFIISGTNNITRITASWAGREVTLMFQAALTVVDGDNLKIAGNFVTSADDTISLVCDGTSWVEKSRAAN